ncbi:MAG TPA: flagellar filament capping protein FliD [Steroidobacteraceae bacterium]|jgi:flagellar hook-associated protein 2
MASSGSSPVSVAGSSSAAAAGGSVINVSSLVSQLVAATRGPQDALISSQTQAVTTQISALGNLKGALATFQSALSALDTPSSFNAMTAGSGDKSVFTASASSSAQPGTYAVTVSTLASAEQLVSSPVAGGASAVIGTGTLQLTLGGASFTVTIDGTDDTLSGIAARINSASGNPGVTATILTGADGAHLVLGSSLTGAANDLQVTETDGGNALSSLTYATGNVGNYTQTAAALDASFKIAGVAYTSSSNTVTGALGGVTLNLLGTNSGSPANLTVATDTTTVQGSISGLVGAYNTLVGALSTLDTFDSTTNTAGPMMGSALLEGIRSAIRQTLSSTVNTGSSTYNSLASIGITTKSDGTLSLDATTLSNALATNFSAVSQLFSGSGGVASTLNTQIAADLATGGSIDSHSKTLIKQENSLTQQESNLNTQMSALSASLTEQYSALNSLLSSLQTTSAYLSQAFATLPQVQGKSNA